MGQLWDNQWVIGISTSLIVLIIAGLAGWFWRKQLKRFFIEIIPRSWSFLKIWVARKFPRKDRKPLVVVTCFPKSGTTGIPPDMTISRRVFEEIETIKVLEPDIEVKYLNKCVIESREKARKKGRSLKASIVIWGWYSERESSEAYIYPHFEIIEEKVKEMIPIEPEEKKLSLASGISSFDLWIETARELGYLTSLTIGIIYYLQEKYEKALTHFENALRYGATSAK